jgi:hypothetical protein
MKGSEITNRIKEAESKMEAGSKIETDSKIRQDLT